MFVCVKAACLQNCCGLFTYKKLEAGLSIQCILLPFQLVLEHLGEKQFIVKMAVKINDTEYIKVNLNVMFLRLAKGIFR